MKKILISVILDHGALKPKRSAVIIETYENDTCEVTFIPNENKASEDIKKVLTSEHPDMCLLVVEDWFKTQEVWQQIEKLHEMTGKPTEEFTVVLPLKHEPEESYPFIFYTREALFSKLAKDRSLRSTNKR